MSKHNRKLEESRWVGDGPIDLVSILLIVVAMCILAAILVSAR